MKHLLSDINLAPPNGFRGQGPLGLEGADATTAPTVFNKFLTSIIGLMTIVVVIWFIITLITGAIGVLSAGGDKTAMENARKRIVSGLVGLIITIAALFIVSLVGELIGIKNILNPAEMLKQIK